MLSRPQRLQAERDEYTALFPEVCGTDLRVTHDPKLSPIIDILDVFIDKQDHQERQSALRQLQGIDGHKHQKKSFGRKVNAFVANTRFIGCRSLDQITAKPRVGAPRTTLTFGIFERETQDDAGFVWHVGTKSGAAPRPRSICEYADGSGPATKSFYELTCMSLRPCAFIFSVVLSWRMQSAEDALEHPLIRYIKWKCQKYGIRNFVGLNVNTPKIEDNEENTFTFPDFLERSVKHYYPASTTFESWNMYDQVRGVRDPDVSTWTNSMLRGRQSDQELKGVPTEIIAAMMPYKKSAFKDRQELSLCTR